MSLKNSKKGSHVDVILSFLLFIFFVIFLIAMVDPINSSTKDKKQTAEYLKLKMVDKIKEDIVVINIINASTKTLEDCISLNKTNLNISGMTPIAKDFTGNYSPTKDSGELEIKWINNSGFFRVYYSEGNFNSHTTTDSLTCEDGEIKSVRYIKEVTEASMNQFVLNYNSSYNTLKSELGIVKNEDFAIQFEFNNGTIIGSAPKDAKLERYAERYQISYFDKEANKKSGYITIYIW